MAAICSPWLDALQGIIAVAGTFLLAFSLKTIRETDGNFNTMDPRPVSSRMWWGLGLISIAALPTILRALVGGCNLPSNHISPGAAGPVIGFISGWGLFEVTEFRRRTVQKGAVRASLLSELRQAEVTLAVIVVQRSWGAPDARRAVGEWRWLVDDGRKHFSLASIEVPAELAERTRGKTDDEIVSILRAMPPIGRNRAIKLSLPILESTLRGQTAAFSREEVDALGDINWQAYLFAEETYWINYWLQSSFTASEVNHPVITQNHNNSVEAYRKRAEFLLESIRRTTKLIESRLTSTFSLKRLYS